MMETLFKHCKIDKIMQAMEACNLYHEMPLHILCKQKFISNGILKGFNPEEDPDKPGWRRQDLTPAAYVRNGSLYAMTYNQIIKNKKRLTNQTQAYIMEENKSINIDEPLDLLIAEHLMKNENK